MEKTFDSYVVIVTSADDGKTYVSAFWEVEECESNTALYVKAMKTAAALVAKMGVGNVLVHIELCNT